MFNRLKINNIRQILIGAYIREIPNINYLKPFNYKYYKYIDLKLLLTNKRKNKLIILNRPSVFIKYFKKTIK